MTKRQTMEYKYSNAVRAFHGGFYTPPQKEAIHRVHRWKTRLEAAGIPLPTVVIRALPK